MYVERWHTKVDKMRLVRCKIQYTGIGKNAGKRGGNRVVSNPKGRQKIADLSRREDMYEERLT